MVTLFLRTLILVVSVTSLANAKVILWDLGGVLFKESRLGFARSIGIMNCISYGLSDRQGFSPKPVLFETLKTLGNQKEAPGMSCICDSDGMPLPQIMCDWLKGTLTAEELLKRIETQIQYLDMTSFFVSQREKKPCGTSSLCSL